MKETAPYGTWKSPITSDLIVSESIGLGGARFDGEEIYWLEMRPSEGGRNVLVRRTPDGSQTDVTPPPFNVRTRVHEYGGGSFTVHDGIVYIANFDDQRLYRIRPDEKPEAVTEKDDRRFADFVVDERHNRLIAVCEDHSGGGHPDNMIVAVDAETGQITTLVSGNDFYAAPRLSPDGNRLAWLTWHHPNMPWDGTELWTAGLRPDGTPETPERVAGGPTESIFQPEWSPDGILYFISDRSGWWNIYRWKDGQAETMTRMEAEFGEPQWVFGMSTYGFESPDQIICTYSREGMSHLARLDTRTADLKDVSTPCTSIGAVHVRPGQSLFSGASPTEPRAVVRLDTATGETEILRQSFDNRIDPGYFSIPEPIDYPTTGGETAHAIFYLPKNKDYRAPAGEKPPLLVFSHGGPTAAVGSAFNLTIQYWTSRGIAVLDVNYGGSTGYGREYRERLRGKWGIVDVDDCVNGAGYLADRGDVDGDRLAIRGGSAGGFTTLAVLTFREVFKAGASYFGVSDLEALARDTHKFESRYLDGLVGPYPERKDLYMERAPIHAVDRLSCPVIFLQGLEDKIVPPNQAETMVEALRKKGIPVAYIPFEGEQHGFRRSENIKRAMDAELYFYGRIFGFAPADEMEPVEIFNFK